MNDASLAVARADLDRLLAKAPRIRRNLAENRFEVHVSATGHPLTELPEFRAKRGTITKEGEDFDAHMQGGKGIGSIVACTEATLAPKDDGHCVHELAHGIEFNALQPSVRERMAHLHDDAVASGRWKGEYGAKSYGEWFAESTRLWFFDPDRLKRIEADAFAFVDSLYRDGIDPGDAPREHVLTPSPASEEGRAKSRPSWLPVRVRVKNATAQKVRLSWLDFEGKRDRRGEGWAQTVAPGQTEDLATFADHCADASDDG